MLRPLWDEELGNVNRGDDTVDKMRLEWRRQLDWLEIIAAKVINWVKEEYKEWRSRPPDPTMKLIVSLHFVRECMSSLTLGYP